MVKDLSYCKVLTYTTPAHSSFWVTADARSVAVSLNQSVVTLWDGEGNRVLVTETYRAFRAVVLCSKDSIIESNCRRVVAVEDGAWAGGISV